MPRQNGTGPRGNGPKTGRGLGSCPPNSQKSNRTRSNSSRGNGNGRGLGRRR